MTKIIKPLFLLLVLALGLFATGCPQRISIADIAADPAKYQDKEIIVSGTVRDSYGITVPGTRYGGGAYKIDDGTGSIWVITDAGIPSKGAQLGVKGIVGSGVAWKGKTFGLGMYENDRKFKKR